MSWKHLDVIEWQFAIIDCGSCPENADPDRCLELGCVYSGDRKEPANANR